MRAQVAGVGPDQLLGGQPAHTLHETAFDLADVDGGVDAGADVVQDVHGQHARFAGQGVNSHFAASSAVSKVIKRPARERGLVVVNFGRAIKTIAPQLNAVGIGKLDDLFKGPGSARRYNLAASKAHCACAAVVKAGHKLGNVALHMACRVLRRACIQVGAGRCCGGRSVGYFAGVAGRCQYVFKTNAQLVRDDLADLGVQALAHFGAAMVNLHAAVGVHMHQRTRLVEQRGGERNAKFDGCDGDAAFDDRAGCVPCVNRFTPLPVVRRLLQF